MKRHLIRAVKLWSTAALAVLGLATAAHATSSHASAVSGTAHHVTHRVAEIALSDRHMATFSTPAAPGTVLTFRKASWT